MKQALIIFIGLTLLSCKKEEGSVSDAFENVATSIGEVPPGFPAVEYPEDNPFSIDKWKLGKKLFFDPILSEDNSVSCASCHEPADAFADTRAVSLGVQDLEGTRNSPSLANVAYHPYYTREGGVPTLEMQVLVPIQEHNEFGTNIVVLAERLASDAEYVQMSQQAFDRDPDPYVITRAIATFERTLLSGNSAYDRFAFSGDRQALNIAERRGMSLFFSDRTNCSQCHADFNFTNYALENNGLYESYADPGKFRLTLDSSDLGRFKVASLRNVALTAPYMHDGSMETLTEVVRHYNSGGKTHPNKSALIKPLQLSDKEVTDLVSFLETLTDASFITNTNLRNE